MVIRMALVLILGLSGCAQKPSTVDECILEYAKPGIASDVAQMAIAACVNQLSDASPDTGAPRVSGPFDFTMPSPQEMALHLWRDLLSALPATTLVWACSAAFGRAFLGRRLRWYLGIPSFVVTWVATALWLARFGEHPLMYFVVPLVFAALTLMPLLGMERSGKHKAG